jgi:DNA-binding response OmpR family regulator
METLLSFQPDLMVLDIRMPDENGWMVCSRLRRDKRFDSIPILFLSALGDEISVKKGYLSGGDFFLPKPFDIKELLRVVESLIGRKHRYPDEDVTLENLSLQNVSC